MRHVQLQIDILEVMYSEYITRFTIHVKGITSYKPHTRLIHRVDRLFPCSFAEPQHHHLLLPRCGYYFNCCRPYVAFPRSLITSLALGAAYRR